MWKSSYNSQPQHRWGIQAQDHILQYFYRKAQEPGAGVPSGAHKTVFGDYRSHHGGGTG